MNESDIINEQLRLFEQFLMKENRSVNTASSYMFAVRLYYRWYPEITLENLQEFKRCLLRKYSPNTVNSRICAMNHYIRFLEHCTAELADQELAGYQLPHVKIQKQPFVDNIISQEDYEFFKDCLKRDGNYFWYFVIRFITATGARVSELVQIKAEHLQLGYMDLYSKGGKLRRIYFPDTLIDEAMVWLTRRGIRSGFLFLNHHGRQITPRGINFQLKKLAGSYGLDTMVIYAHSFRHRFAKNFLSKFNDISLLADLMGHENIETTRIYLKKTSGEQRHLIDEIVIW